MSTSDASSASAGIAEQIDGYLRTGVTSDPWCTAWPGGDFFEGVMRAQFCAAH